MAGSAGFWNVMAARYARQPVADEESYRRKLDETRALLTPDMTVLEVGCGTGTTAIHHAPHVAHIDALDISHRMLAIAREKAASAGIENIAFIEADVERMAEAGPRYDLAMAHSILHLVDDKAALLAALHRALKPGGRLVASTACLGGTMPWLRLLLPVGAFLGLLPRVAFFTVEELETAMEAAGFRVERRWLPGPRKGVFHIAVKPAG